MKCTIGRKQYDRLLLAAGLVLLAAGLVWSRLQGEESGAAVRIAGFISGLGLSFAVISGGIMVRRRLIGPKKSEDCELEMLDERGQAISGKAQSALGLCAMLCIVLIVIVATVRGDTLYMGLGAAGCLACAATKWAALAVYGRRM